MIADGRCSSNPEPSAIAASAATEQPIQSQEGSGKLAIAQDGFDAQAELEGE